MSEDELKAKEAAELATQLDGTSAQLDAQQKKLQGLLEMVMPLLRNLAVSPEKAYLYWPNRVQKINQFIDQLYDYVNS